jgi:large subunit ribosomal protein L7Ae
MADFVKFSVPKELMDKQMALIEKIKKEGKIKVGVNEVTKMVERGTAKMVFIAQDVSPAEIVMHLPLICKEKNIPFSYVATKKELGEKAGIGVGTAAIAVVNEGDNKKEIESLAKKIAELK